MRPPWIMKLEKHFVCTVPNVGRYGHRSIGDVHGDVHVVSTSRSINLQFHNTPTWVF